MIKLALTTVFYTITAGAAFSDAVPDRFSIMAASKHIGANMEFNEKNLGLFLTWGGPSFDLTIGAFRNSYDRQSITAIVGKKLVEWNGGSLSPFIGVAHYPVDGHTFRFHAGDFVPVAGIQLIHKNAFMMITPSDGVMADAVMSFGVTFKVKKQGVGWR